MTSQEKTAQVQTTLVLRTSNHDGKAYNGFQWPTSGPVECPDWKDNAECGNGLHGIVWPDGDWSDIKEYDKALWQVVEVVTSSLVTIGGKVKFPRGNVVYSGEFAIAFNMVVARWMAEFKPKDNNKKHNESDAKIGSSGYSAKIGSSGYYAQIGSSGDSAKIGSSGYYAKIGSSGDSAKIGSSGDSAQIDNTGTNATIACAGSVKQFRAGENGCIAIPYNDGNRNRFAIGYVGENIKANTWYCLDDVGNFQEI